MATDSISIARQIIAVDGPADAGKSTTSRALSAYYELPYLESGMAYRYLAYLALRRGVDIDDGQAMLRLCSGFVNESGERQGLLEESRKHADELRGAEIGAAVPAVSRLPELRGIITELIRSWASGGNGRGAVVEGRDIGAVVFPGATTKFFLTADPEIRAERRWADEGGTYHDILDDVVRCDAADRARAPFLVRPAKDAMIIDTGELLVEEVLSLMIRRCDELRSAATFVRSR